MAEDKKALLQHYRESRTELLAALDGLSDELMTEPALDGWSVKDHLAHLALWDDMRASEVARMSAGHVSAWRATEEQVGAYNALGYELRRGLSLEQVRWELEDSRRRLLDAIMAATIGAMDGSLYGEAGLCSDHEAEHAGWLRRYRDSRLAGR